MTDIEIIQQMEKILRIPLVKLEPGAIEKRATTYSDIKRGYAMDDTGVVTGLRLEGLYIKPVLELLSRLHGINRLHLESCWLKQSDIHFLQHRENLAFLNISINKGIHDFSFLRELKGLTSVDLRWNKLTDVSFLQELKGLTSVDLRMNKLTDVSVLRELKGLTSVDLRMNKLTDVSVLRELKGLTSVNLRFNKVTDLSFVSDLDHLTHLNIEGNPIKNPPPKIAKQGLKAIQDYFRSLKNCPEKKPNEDKILLVGDGVAGKTSLIKRLISKYL